MGPDATYSARMPTRMNADPRSRYRVSFIAAYSLVPTPVRPHGPAEDALRAHLAARAPDADEEVHRQHGDLVEEKEHEEVERHEDAVDAGDEERAAARRTPGSAPSPSTTRTTPAKMMIEVSSTISSAHAVDGELVLDAERRDERRSPRRTGSPPPRGRRPRRPRTREHERDPVADDAPVQRTSSGRCRAPNMMSTAPTKGAQVMTERIGQAGFIASQLRPRSRSRDPTRDPVDVVLRAAGLHAAQPIARGRASTRSAR